MENTKNLSYNLKSPSLQPRLNELGHVSIPGLRTIARGMPSADCFHSSTFIEHRLSAGITLSSVMQELKSGFQKYILTEVGWTFHKWLRLVRTVPPPSHLLLGLRWAFLMGLDWGSGSRGQATSTMLGFCQGMEEGADIG